jgi:outer membrane protein assembly factor BamA
VNKKTKIYLMIVFLIMTIPLLGAQDRISSVEISGLKRTKNRTIMNIIKVKEGDPVTPDLTNQVEQRLKKTGIFLDEVVVELVPGLEGQILKIHVEDRWTLIGLPFFGITQEKWIAGVFAVDSNLFGTQKIVVTSLMLDQLGSYSAFFLFRDPAFLQSDYQFTLLMGGGNSQEKLTDLTGNEKWEDFSRLGFNGALGVGYQLTDQINLSGNINFSSRNDTPGDTTPPGAGETRVKLGLSPRIQYDNRYIHSLFSSGFMGSFTPEMAWGPLSDFSFSQEGSLSYSVVPVDSLLVKFTIKEGLSKNSFDSLMILGGSEGSLTLPGQSIGTSQYINGETLLEFRLINFGFASLTVPLFYEGGYLLDYHSQYQFYHGAGAGFRFYLAKVAAPALGMDYRYSFTNEKGGFSAFIGMQF